MSPQEFSYGTYCTIAETVTFDSVAGRVEIAGSVTDAGVRNRVRVIASEVTQFLWEGGVKEPDGLFELSTVEIRSQPEGWLVVFEPWYTSKLRFACKTLQLNGQVVEGHGAWYQDSLEGPIPASA